MNAYYVKLRYYKMRTHTHTHIYIYISQLIINVYLNRKILNLIIENYPKQ